MDNLLADSEERVFFKDLESRFLLVSAGWLAALAHGRSPQEVIGKTDFDIFSRPHATTAFADEQRVIATGQPMLAKVERETFHDRPDAWVSTTKLPLRDAHGNIIGSWGISRDITAQIDAEQALAASHEQLRASERQYRLLFEHNPLPMVAYERGTLGIVAVSDAAVAGYGYSREEFLTLTMKDLMPVADHESLEQFLKTTVSGEHPGLVQANPWRHRYKDGTLIDVEISGNDLDLGGLSCRILLCQNVTERNKASVELELAREQLRASEQRYRLLFERNPQAMVAYDRQSLQIVAVNNAMVASYGYSRQELLAMTIRDLVPPEDVDMLLALLAANPNGLRPGLASGGMGHPGHHRHQHKDGTIIDVEVASDNIDLDGRECRVSIYHDVTERNRATAELMEAREQLRTSAEEHRLLFEHNPQPMLAYDCETLRIVAVSDAATVSMGYSREECMNMTLLDIAPAEDHPAMRDYARTHFDGERLGLQLARPRRHLCKDGTVLDVEVTSDDLVLGGRKCRVCLTEDVTERNRASAALAIARDQAVEASNMKSAFLANMSHEIRTPMNGVIGMTELLLEMGLTDEQRECAQQIARSGEQMLSTINDILDISKIETGHLELDITDFDLPETIKETCSAAAANAEAKGLRLELQIAEAVPRCVRGDSRRLHQVLLNLVTNAIKFTSAGAVTVRVDVAAPPSDRGARVRIEVADSGIGIDPEALHRMFEPFTQADVSTTRLYGGTGLGLAIARELVELMGGTISAESTPGEGSTFRFELELAAAATNGRPPRPDDVGAAAAAPLWSTAPLVLVAEDSPINQIVAVRMLERCGCGVDVVGDGRQALEALSRQRYDAVLMDCQMPEMDGYEATAELRRRENGDHRTPVIAMTAHAMDGDRKRCLDAGMDGYISKPMRRQQLIDTLREWIPPQTAAAAADDPRRNDPSVPQEYDGRAHAGPTAPLARANENHHRQGSGFLDDEQNRATPTDTRLLSGR